MDLKEWIDRARRYSVPDTSRDSSKEANEQRKAVTSLANSDKRKMNQDQGLSLSDSDNDNKGISD